MPTCDDFWKGLVHDPTDPGSRPALIDSMNEYVKHLGQVLKELADFYAENKLDPDPL